jgi:hypothetical protein
VATNSHPPTMRRTGWSRQMGLRTTKHPSLASTSKTSRRKLSRKFLLTPIFKWPLHSNQSQQFQKLKKPTPQTPLSSRWATSHSPLPLMMTYSGALLNLWSSPTIESKSRI